MSHLIKFLTRCVFIATISALAWQAHAQNLARASNVSSLEGAVVKIFSTHRQADLYRPWTKASPSESTGSGVVIEGNRILTNAHVVNYASKVEVRAREGGDKFIAKVIAIARGIDLAVLELEDNSFFNGRKAPERANVVPEIKDEVLAYGYPMGGNSLSITKGIVSRIEFVQYNFPTQGLRIQIDAAINPGNSGGPVFSKNKMIGVAFSGITSAQNIGYIIPNDEVEIFLKDIADGKYDGKPQLQDDTQTLENPSLRSFLKVDKNVRGVVVSKVNSKEANYPLKEWDIITHIGSTEIDNQGLVKLSEDLQVRYQYQVQKSVVNGMLPITVWRQGKALPLQLPIARQPKRLIETLNGDYPSYFIYGPIVFSRATWEFRNFFSNNAGSINGYAFNAQPLVTRLADYASPERQDLVVISSPFFPHRLVSGYDSRFGAVVHSINEQPVRSLRHLVEVLRDLKTEFVTIKFDQNTSESVVLPHAKMLEATEEILKDNGIRFQASEDLQDAWKPATSVTK